MVNVANRKQTVGVVFGSRSVEHDVSIVTAQQIIRALDPSRYEVVPIYITRRGEWLTGPALTDLKTFEVERIEELMGVRDTLISPSTAHHGMITPALSPMLSRNQLKRLDVVFPAIHGTHGEDGTLQGLCELADLPYVGCGVMASAIANDKALTKVIMRAHGIPVVEGITVKRGDWQQARAQVIESLDALGYPLFVKPAKLGSSIGIARPKDAKAAAAALDVAFNLDQTVVVEKALEGALEINCAVIGNHTPRPSLLEQPISFEEFLTYEEKYMRGGASKGMKGAERKIPAPLPQPLTEQIQQMAVAAFKAIDGRGIARVDFLLKDGEVYLNEINTMPGSLAFYLWQAEGMPPAQVVDELIRLAHEDHKDKTRTMFDYKTGLVSLAATRGLKGVKGGKFGKKF
ncbi:MAG: D-alanine--D-alanine ligase family protein [Anaerolineae bacterium]